MAIELKNISSQLPPTTYIKDLGMGAFGLVKQVRRDDDSQIYALKESLPPFECLRAYQDGTEIFSERVEVDIYDCIQSAGSHPQVLKCHAFEAGKEAFSFLMDYFPGQTLCDAHFSSDSSRLIPLFSVKSSAYQFVSALEFFKKNSIIHGDINLSNVLTDGKMIKIIDFGSGCIAGKHKVRALTNWASYRSPSVVHSQAHEPYSYEADTFAAGCVIRALLTREAVCFPYFEQVVEDFLRSNPRVNQKSSAEQEAMIDRFEKKTLTAMHKITFGQPTGRFRTEEILSGDTQLPNIPGGIGKPKNSEETRELYREVRGGENDDILFFLTNLVRRMIKWEPDSIEDIIRGNKEDRVHVIADEPDGSNKMPKGE